MRPDPAAKEGYSLMSQRSLSLCLVVLLAAGAAAAAQVPSSIGKAAVVTETAVIVAIDAANRLVSLKGEDGAVETVVAGPEVKRFSELKVGDKVTFKFYESVVYAIQQPGAKAPVPEAAGVTRSTGPKPGGTMAQRLTAVVTVQAIDPKIPSITIKSEDGNTLSLKVEDPANLTGVKVGDKVEITYTRALAISVESPK
jgi:Cu/Ag efflux protein CusF